MQQLWFCHPAQPLVCAGLQQTQSPLTFLCSVSQNMVVFLLLLFFWLLLLLGWFFCLPFFSWGSQLKDKGTKSKKHKENCCEHTENGNSAYCHFILWGTGLGKSFLSFPPQLGQFPYLPSQLCVSFATLFTIT